MKVNAMIEIPSSMGSVTNRRRTTYWVMREKSGFDRPLLRPVVPRRQRLHSRRERHVTRGFGIGGRCSDEWDVHATIEDVHVREAPQPDPRLILVELIADLLIHGGARVLR